MDTTAMIQESCSENQGPGLLAFTYVLLSMATIIITLRIFFKCTIPGGVGKDDIVIVLSLIAGIIGTGGETEFVRYGMGRHIYCLPVEQLPQVLKWSVISQIFNNMGIGLAKISVCLCVLRIIDRTRRRLTAFLWTVTLFAAASHFVQIMLFIVQCRPMAAYWDKNIHGKCFSVHITYLVGYIGFGLDGVTDIICAAIPISILHRLQINFRTKVALCVLMGLGSLTAACALAKGIMLHVVFTDDWTWKLMKPAYCTIIEHLVGITLVSLPALGPIYKRIFNMKVSSSSSQRYPPRTSITSGRVSYVSNQSPLGSDAVDLETVPSYDRHIKIVKTTDFRMHSARTSEHNLQDSGHWPPPSSSTLTNNTERSERMLV